MMDKKSEINISASTYNSTSERNLIISSKIHEQVDFSVQTKNHSSSKNMFIVLRILVIILVK